MTHHPKAGQQCQADREDQEPDADHFAVDRDRAQTVRHEGDEVHRGTTAEPPGAMRGDGAVRLFRMEGRRGVVVPELGDGHQALQPPAWDGAEVAHAHPDAGQEEMQVPVKEVEGPKRERLRAPGPLGEHDRMAPLCLEPGEQAGHVLGRILAVAVHYHDGLVGRRHPRLDVGQADGDGPLMAQVAPQSEHLDTPQCPVLAERGPRVRVDDRSVVNDQNVGFAIVGRQDLVELHRQLREGVPIVKKRNEDDERRGGGALRFSLRRHGAIPSGGMIRVDSLP